MTDYRVQTDIYNGPLDLLLYLIRRDEIEIQDIPVAEVTRQYCVYVELLKEIDPNVAGEFLIMATVLMEIKSRMLLPRPVAEEGEAEDLGDPRLELVRQLLEYKKFKDATFELRDAAERQAQRWSRSPAKRQASDAPEVDLEDVQIWDLVAAFNKVMASIGAGQASHEVVYDDTPIAMHAADILDRLQREAGELTFEQVFIGRTKSEMIGLFLALLELMRQQRVQIVQQALFEQIHVRLISADPIEIGDEWTPALQEAVLGTAESDIKPLRGEAEDGNVSAFDQSGPESDEAGEDDAEEMGESFADLEKINVDFDVDSILKQASNSRSSPEADADENAAP